MYHKKKYSSFLLMSALMLLPLTGCSQDEILNQYNNVVQSAGNATLTGDLSLKGKRTYGDDHYTGTYAADYKDFSKTEYLFGGTSIERENGKDISVSCNLKMTEGTAQVFWISGSDDPVILLEISSCVDSRKIILTFNPISPILLSKQGDYSVVEKVKPDPLNLLANTNVGS